MIAQHKDSSIISKSVCSPMNKTEFKKLKRDIHACQICRDTLPLGPRPVVNIHPDARIMIIGQAPGTRVHETGIPWNDPSGNRLREWMDVSKKEFYDPTVFAIMPMGFCYPGKGKSGDLPPRPECAPHWHHKILEHLPNIKVTLLIGQYAQNYYLKKSCKKTLTETVKQAENYLPDYFPLVHPSPRNTFWLRKNPWFDQYTIPLLRQTLNSSINKFV